MRKGSKLFLTLPPQACHFHVPGAIDAIKKSLTLIWRTEGNIESETKRAFIQVIFALQSMSMCWYVYVRLGVVAMGIF